MCVVCHPSTALVYIGLTLGAPIAGSLLTKYQPKKVIMASLALNAVSVLCFGLAPRKYLLFLARFMIGLTQVGLPHTTASAVPPHQMTTWHVWGCVCIYTGLHVHLCASVGRRVLPCPLSDKVDVIATGAAVRSDTVDLNTVR